MTKFVSLAGRKRKAEVRSEAQWQFRLVIASLNNYWWSLHEDNQYLFGGEDKHLA